MFNYYQNINWVQGLEGAKAYQIYPNSSVILMDSENDNTMYIKTSDHLGISKIRTFKYEEVEEVQKNYVTREEVLEMLKGVNNEQTIPRDGRSKNESSRGNGNKVKNDE
mgnify:FL=1